MERKGRKNPAQVITGRFLPRGGVLPVTGEKCGEKKSRESLPPLVTAPRLRSGAGRDSYPGRRVGGWAVPAGRPGCRPETRGLLGV